MNNQIDLSNIQYIISECAHASAQLRMNEDAIDYCDAIASIMKYCSHMIECAIYESRPNAIDDELKFNIDMMNRDYQLHIKF